MDQRDFLLAHHCDEGQGNYFSPPLTADDFAQLLQTRSPLDHFY